MPARPRIYLEGTPKLTPWVCEPCEGVPKLARGLRWSAMRRHEPCEECAEIGPMGPVGGPPCGAMNRVRGVLTWA